MNTNLEIIDFSGSYEEDTLNIVHTLLDVCFTPTEGFIRLASQLASDSLKDKYNSLFSWAALHEDFDQSCNKLVEWIDSCTSDIDRCLAVQIKDEIVIRLCYVPAADLQNKQDPVSAERYVNTLAALSAVSNSIEFTASQLISMYAVPNNAQFPDHMELTVPLTCIKELFAKRISHLETFFKYASSLVTNTGETKLFNN